MARRSPARASMISATRRKHVASATLEPPHLCTTHVFTPSIPSSRQGAHIRLRVPYEAEGQALPRCRCEGVTAAALKPASALLKGARAEASLHVGPRRSRTVRHAGRGAETFF